MQSLLLHELAEVLADDGSGYYPDAHDEGIYQQNAFLSAMERGGRRLPGQLNDNFDPATGNISIKIPWRDVRREVDGFEVFRGRIFTNDGRTDFALSNIARGVLDTGVPYDGTGRDIQIESITFEAAPLATPEPSGIVLMAVGASSIAIWRVIRRRRDRK